MLQKSETVVACHNVKDIFANLALCKNYSGNFAVSRTPTEETNVSDAENSKSCIFEHTEHKSISFGP